MTEERNVVKPPNEDRWKRDDERENGFLPLAGHASPISPNEMHGGDRRAGSYPLGGQASPVMPPNQTGGDRRVGSLAFPTPTAIEPGRRAVPVNPGLVGKGVAPPSEMKRGR
jgi:hypothetical protein